MPTRVDAPGRLADRGHAAGAAAGAKGQAMTVEDRFLNLLPAGLRACVERGVPLRDLTTLRVGGPAALVCPAHNPEQARRFHDAAIKSGLPWFVLGGGSNVLADDRGFGGAVLRVAGQACGMRGDIVTVSAGLGFDELVARTLKAGLTGLEFASGIPGTLGGALAGNAGCYGHEIREFVRQATVMTAHGDLAQVGPDDFGFRYRGTALRDSGAVILEAVLELRRGDVAAAAEERRAHLADRLAKHPVSEPSAGSWFRNLEPAEPGARRQPAGALLEQVGAKSMREGDAAVYPKHANIIINLGRAGSDDVRRLVARMRDAVRERYGVTLEEEVRYLDPETPASV
jgi:UDP-N-acetylmuramate dehydrogenase